MSQYNDRETLSTLRFGNRAKSIKNALKQNAQRSAKELLGLLNVAEEKIKNHAQIISLIQSRLLEMVGQESAEFDSIKEQIDEIARTKDLSVLKILLEGSS